MPAQPPETQFQLHAPEDIRAALFELNHPDSRIAVRNVAGEETQVEIVALDGDARRIYWRPRGHGRTSLASAELKNMLAGSHFDFDAQGYGGVVVRFRVQRPVIVYSDDGEPALASPFPDQLLRIQRRKSFRAAAIRAQPPASAKWRPEQSGQAIAMRIHDISLDGLGLRAEVPVDALPAVGETLRDVTLNFGAHGEMLADLVVRSRYALGRQDDAAGPAGAPARRAGVPPPLSHLGVSFAEDMEPRQQSWLQQIVWRMERAK